MLVALTFALTPNQHLRSPAICEFAEGCGWEACWVPTTGVCCAALRPWRRRYGTGPVRLPAAGQPSVTV